MALTKHGIVKSNLTSLVSKVRCRRGIGLCERLEQRSSSSRGWHRCKQLRNIRRSSGRSNAKRLGQGHRRLDTGGICLGQGRGYQWRRHLRLVAGVVLDSSARNRGRHCRHGNRVGGGQYWILWYSFQINLSHTFCDKGGIG